MMIRILFLCLSCFVLVANAKTSNLSYIESANGERKKKVSNLVKWTHTRFVFDRDIERVAVGHDKTLDVNVVGGRELLILAKRLGRTSMIVWYDNNSSETFLLGVTEDYSVLENAIKDIHPALKIAIAPDRHAIVLRGRVPTESYRYAAYTAAKNYLYASSSSQDLQPAVSTDPSQSTLQSLSQRLKGLGGLGSGLSSQSSKVAIINLIKVTESVKAKEEKISDVIKSLGEQNVTVKRLSAGTILDDNKDVFMLSGKIKNQIQLVRLLNAINTLFKNDVETANSPVNSNGVSALNSGQVDDAAIKVLANESGSLISKNNNNTKISNVESNIARATLLSLAGGRVLSTIEVEDLPQVRVSVQLYEVNQRKLEQWRPDITARSEGYNEQGAFSLAGLSSKGQDSSTVENALQLIGGQLTNNLQLSTSQFAIDMLFSLLEQQGISKTLSRPTITVLSGESAVFKVGGEVPVPTSFSPSGIGSDQAGSAGSVFSGTEFKSFGVELSVRALVDDKDRITLDLNPVISLPDTVLTAEIAQSTGNSLNSSAFNTRSLQTSTRLNDGQPIIIAGLINNDNNSSHDFVPNGSGGSIFGKLTEANSNSENNRELVIVVTPNIVRQQKNDLSEWSTIELDKQFTTFVGEKIL